MKYTFYIVAAVLLFTACKKKKDPTNCYICTRTNTQTSNVSTLNKVAEVYTDSLCNYNDARIKMYEKDHKHSDTAYVYGDTLVVNNWESKCIVE